MILPLKIHSKNENELSWKSDDMQHSHILNWYAKENEKKTIASESLFQIVTGKKILSIVFGQQYVLSSASCKSTVPKFYFDSSIFFHQVKSWKKIKDNKLKEKKIAK